MNNLIIGIDWAPNGDIFCLQVFKRDGDRFELLNSFYEDEARELYLKLITKKEK